MNAERNKFRTVALLDTTYKKLNDYCAKTGIKKFITASAAIEEYLRRKK